MLFKIVVKEREQAEGGLMKYLRFRLKRDFATKGSAEGLLCPGARRKQGPSCNRYKEGPY